MPSRPRQLPQVLLTLIALLAAGFVPAVAKQAAPAAIATKAPGKPAVEPIPPGDIPMRADTDERFVQQVTSRAQQRDRSRKLGPQLNAIAAGIRRLSGSFNQDELQQLPAIRLESLENHWNFYDRQLAGWRRELQGITARYSDDAAELAKRRAAWEATRADMATNGVAPALSDRVGVILAQIAAAEQAVSGPLDNQINLGRSANALQASIDAGEKAVSSAIHHYDRRLVMVDSPPLWTAWHDTASSPGAVDAAVAAIVVERDFLREFVMVSGTRLQAYGIGALLLLPLLLWLARRSRRVVSDDPEMQASAKVLLRPVSAWLVVALVGVTVVFPEAPLVLHQAALLLAMVPVLRLLPRQVFTVLGPWPYIATALYVMKLLLVLLLGHPLYYRLYLIGLAALAIIALVWLLQSRRRKVVVGFANGVRTALRAVGWLAVFGMLISVIANVVGNISLAEMLCDGILESAYTGLALYAGAAVLTAMVKLLLARRAAARFRIVTQHTGPLLQGLGKLIKLSAAVTWVVVVLNEFRIYRPVADGLKRVLAFPLEAGQLSITLGSILMFLISVWIAFWISRTTRIVLQDEILPKMALPRGVGNSISTLSYYALLTIGVFVALVAAGFQLGQLTLVVGALGVGIGFGLQNVVNNFVSGLILMFERPVQPGDVVEVSGTSGTVRDIGMRATTLTTFEGADVIVPNGTLLSEKLINWTLSDMNRRIDVNVGVAYGSNPRQVLELLMDVARSTPGIAAQPVPAVLFVSFGPNSLDFAIRAWTHNFGDWVAIRSDMTVRVYDALIAAGIEIPFPQHDLHLRSIAPEVHAGLAAAATSRPPGG